MKRIEIENGFVENNLIYRSGWAKVPDKQIGEVREDDLEGSIQFFVARFKKIENDLNVLTNRIQNEDNKGSFLVKLQHLQKKIRDHDGLGDYQALAKKIEQLISLIDVFLDENREKNLEIKQGLRKDLEKALTNPSWKESTIVINEILKKWNQTGGLPSEHQSLEVEFKDKVDDYFKRKQDFFEDRRKLSSHYEKQYQKLVEQANSIIKLSGDGRETKIKELRDEWQSVGPISSDTYKKLKTSFEKNIRKVPLTSTKKGLLSLLDRKLKNQELKEHEIGSLLRKLNSFKPSGQKEEQHFRDLRFQLMSLQEKLFVESCCQKRFKGFNDKPGPEKKKLKQKILRELLDRDKREMATITLNHEKFNSNSTSFSELMDKKLEDQNFKIKIKESILSELLGRS